MVASVSVARAREQGSSLAAVQVNNPAKEVALAPEVVSEVEVGLRHHQLQVLQAPKVM